MKELLFTITIIVLTITVTGQSVPAYKTLIDTATKKSSLFISIYPVKNIELILNDTLLYIETLKYEYNYKIDKAILINLINNSKNPDTTKWTKSDLPNFVLVDTVERYFSSNKIIAKFNLTDKSQIKKIKREVAEFNDSQLYNKNIFYLSKPIFDNTKTFAIISHGTGNKGRIGKEYITLFHYNGITWIKIGVVTGYIY